ncbi:MAG: zinc ABC transporter substrate-binding protein [Desulfoprunum sp.]|nr:zinc ABC transporter substrate-binding protein [Desulfoprunum sp.]
MKLHLTALSLLLVYLLSCASASWAAPMEVYVSIPPQKWLSDELGGDRVITHVLVTKGRDPHTYEPTPKQISALARTKVYFTIGLEFEKQITQKLAATVANLRLVDSTHGITRIPMTEDTHETAHKDHGGHTGDDPHVWLSPVNLQIMAKEMAAALVAADPENTTIYERNLARITAELAQLHLVLQKELAPYKGAAFYVFHPSFGYFAKEYNLRQQAVEIAGKSPSPRQLSALIGMARQDKMKIIFVQPQFDTKSAQTVAQAIDGIVEPLDPLAEDVVGNLKIITEKITSALNGKEGRKN